jgi:hypothetical protein
MCVFFIAVFLPEHPLLILVLTKQDEQRHLALWRSKDVPVPAYLQPSILYIYMCVCQRHDTENPLSFPLVSLCQSSSCPLAACLLLFLLAQLFLPSMVIVAQKN